MADIKRINTRAELKELAAELGVRPDWHEPDERGVSALVSGHMLDNAGFWGVGGTGDLPSAYQELWVTITVQEEGCQPRPVAEVNLAMLLAWSCGYEDAPRPRLVTRTRLPMRSNGSPSGAAEQYQGEPRARCPGFFRVYSIRSSVRATGRPFSMSSPRVCPAGASSSTRSTP